MNMRDSIAAAHIGGPQSNADGASVLEFRFGADDPLFAGHFPTYPVLPGVFQLEMARVAAELVLQHPVALREVAKAKFLVPIGPGETVRLELKLSGPANALQAHARFIVSGRPVGEALMLLAQKA
jgi:3-hydroxyacyl-[acyl-carrier-protein] dehydratase